MRSGRQTLGVAFLSTILFLGPFALGIPLVVPYPSMVARAQDGDAKGVRLLDAVAMTMEKQPDILLNQQSVESSRGVLQQQSGAFDTALQAGLSHNHADVPLSSLAEQAGGAYPLTDTSTAGVGLVKQFRTGVTASPSVQIVRTAVTPNNIDTQNAATVSFTITIPLLKGLGVDATGAPELAAKRDVQASVLTLRHAVSQDVLTTASAYWSYLAAVKILEQRKESKSRAELNFRDTRKLIEGDERAGGDIQLVSADLAAKTAACIEAEQTIIKARHTLGLAMGLPYAGIESLPFPADDFLPVKIKEITETGEQLQTVVDQSLLKRADYLASKETKESARILVEQARNGLLPQLDFQIGVGYSGLDEGSRFTTFTSSLWDRVPGASTSASLTYKWPPTNNSAYGVFRQKLAAYNKAAINSDELARKISSSVSQDISNLKNSALGLMKYQEAVDYYRKAVENERKKFFLGMSTMNNVITTEDSLTAAYINWISSESTYAIALAQLRYDTGTLLYECDEVYHIGIDELTTIPFISLQR